LNAAWQAASQDLYQAQQQAEGADGAQESPDAAATDSGSGTGEDVTDVEYEEVDETKKD
jgi:molecular chaperone DnaK